MYVYIFVYLYCTCTRIPIYDVYHSQRIQGICMFACRRNLAWHAIKGSTYTMSICTCKYKSTSNMFAHEGASYDIFHVYISCNDFMSLG